MLLMLFYVGNLFQFLLATVGMLLCALFFWNSVPMATVGVLLRLFSLELILSLFSCGSLSYLSVRPFGIVHTFLFPLGIKDSLMRLDYHLLWAFSNNLFKCT